MISGDFYIFSGPTATLGFRLIHNASDDKGPVVGRLMSRHMVTMFVTHCVVRVPTRERIPRNPTRWEVELPCLPHTVHRQSYRQSNIDFSGSTLGISGCDNSTEYDHHHRPRQTRQSYWTLPGESHAVVIHRLSPSLSPYRVRCGQLKESEIGCIPFPCNYIERVHCRVVSQ